CAKVGVAAGPYGAFDFW
nr:immunoglobulin heavy chain junction region [Macaca mulatta]